MIGRIRRLSSLPGLGLLLVLVAGCSVDPYCIVCPDGGVRDGGLDAMRGDTWLPPHDSGTDTELADACLGSEVCNRFDDDCDGRIDEGVDTSSDLENCGMCGRRCAPAHAFGRCEGGNCLVDRCDVGFLDLDMDPSNGCEYRCLPVAGDDVVCDFRDDDCDGRIDEDVDTANDPMNCGRCGRVCRAPHATGGCAAGECALGICEEGFHDIDGVATNGCEYACTLAAPPDEACNLRDDDCDGTVDEGDPGGGMPCGIDEGECMSGRTRCRLGTLECLGAVAPTTEVCNARDDDCDGRTDESDPGIGRVCGMSTGACEVGREECVGGSLTCVGAIGPMPEGCNNVDDDCDGRIDEDNPDGGASCGSTVGACEAGMLVCTRGSLICMGGVGPVAERCNSIDDDCDGRIDEGNPESGLLCGTDVGRCTPGVQECRMGTLTCVGAIGPTAETCDGTDEDCDSRVDEGNPGGGAACGDGTGECAPGTLQCRGGTLVCEGAIGPRAEVCNTLDDDCDTRTDEGFDLTRDVNHCGRCGNVCSFANALPQCSMGTCRIAACRSGFIDLDGLASNGCEYACTVAGAESCNGRDEDCDGRIDEGLTPPSSFCNPNGVCAGTGATCGGASGWVCLYPPTYQSTESRCDSLDNDCDGRVDEAFPLRGTSCSNGIGSCRRTGTYVCNLAGDAVVCNAPPAGMPGDESCNGMDDDCDGLIDEPGTDDPGTSWRDAIDASAIPHVTFTSGGRTVRIMQYEASRPDASATSAGSLSTIACSRANVVPWTSVTHAQAQAACCALNPGGACPAPGASGWRLCDAADWQVACRGPTGTCRWSYASMCASSQPLICNGMEHDCDSARAGDQDCLYNTASTTFPDCFTDWGGGARLYDMSGNVKEWTATAVSPGVYQVRGGAYQSIEAGRACTFDFTVADQTFSSDNTGFRCCLY